MPYRTTPFFVGGYYHIFNRGNNREPIFFERENYHFFLRQLQKYLIPAKVEIVAYCLMPNHYHLLVNLVSDDLSRVMQPFALSYSKAIAKRYQRTGTLFQGPFKSRLVEKNEYLLHLSRYIHMNPVMAGLAAKPEGWEFSSYREYVNLRRGTFVRPEIVLSQFGCEAYRQFVEEYRKEDFQTVAHLLFDE